MRKINFLVINYDNIIDFVKILVIANFTYFFSLIIIDYKIKNRNKIYIVELGIILISLGYMLLKNCIGFLYSTILLVVLLSSMVFKIKKNSFLYCFLLTMISLTINYIIFLVAASIMYFIKNIIHLQSYVISIMLILCIYSLIMCKLFKIKRLRKWMIFFNNQLINDYLVIVSLQLSVIIMFSIILFRDMEKVKSAYLRIGLIIFPIILFLTIKKSFELYYKQKLLIKDLDETKEELAKTKEELAKAEKENLESSKRSHSLVHRQKALEFQISELRKSKNSKDINKIKQDVENLSKELYGKEVMTQLSKTNIELIDNMFRYMQFECYKNEIRFDLQICGNIYKMINNVINKETLEILLADHIKNAIIAVKHSENSNKSILVKLGKIDDCYGVCIYDSGIEFKEETLKTLGKKPSSTHLDEGGSGMGFLNTFDTLNKYKASLIIDEIGMPCEENYTKVIMIKFDGKNEFKVNSYRQQKAV